MKNELFRKSSIERISSPEQLNDYIKVSKPGVWIVMVALLIMVFSVFYWAIASEMPNTQTLNSSMLVLDKQTQKYVVYSYVTLEQASLIKEGMEAQVSPANISKDEYGYIKGKIAEVSLYPVSMEEAEYNLGNANVADNLITSTNDVQVKIELETDEASSNSLKWSSEQGKKAIVRPGLYCSANIVVSTTRPIDYVFKN